MKNKSIPESKRAARARQRETRERLMSRVRIAAIALGVLVLAVIIYFIVTGQKPAVTVHNGSETPGLVGTKQYAFAPPMLVDKAKQYFATVTLAKGGQFVIQLYPDKAPIAVNSFVFLARQGYFDGVTFHRVLSGFMAQGGDPTGTGGGGPGYTFGNETSDLTFDKAGVVAMGNTGQPNSNGSQFFITFAPQTYLNGGFTIFGQVISGMDVVMGIKLRDPDKQPTYPGDAMQSVTISEK